MKESIREVVLCLLNTWNIKIPLVPIPYDDAFHELCIAEASHRGYNFLEDHSLASFIRGGVVVATTAYAHLPDQNIKILIALWMACFIYIDDKFLQDPEPIYQFQDRFIRGIPQEDPILEVFADLVREISRRLHHVAANIFVTSTLNGVTGLLLEKETQGIQVSPCHSSHSAYPYSQGGAGRRCKISYILSYHVGSSRSLCDPRVSRKPAFQFLHTRHP